MSIKLSHSAFFKTKEEEITEKQKSLDKILSKLSPDEIKDLDDIFSWLYSQVKQETEFNMNE